MNSNRSYGVHWLTGWVWSKDFRYPVRAYVLSLWRWRFEFHGRRIRNFTADSDFAASELKRDKT